LNLVLIIEAYVLDRVLIVLLKNELVKQFDSCARQWRCSYSNLTISYIWTCPMFAGKSA